jgi:hypothetical protein
MSTPRRRVLPVIVTAVAALAAGCATGPQVHAEFDPQVDFSRYATFGFVDPLGTDRAGYATIVSQYLKEAASREMQARGLRPVDADPDLLLNFNARLSEKVQVVGTMPPAVGMGYYGYRRGLYATWPMYTAEPWVNTYDEGTLNIDIVDRARRQMVWEGVAVDTVTDKTTANLKAAIDGAVSAVFAKFPLAPKPAAPSAGAAR